MPRALLIIPRWMDVGATLVVAPTVGVTRFTGPASDVRRANGGDHKGRP
jgi:hypothetical protein